MRKVLAFLLILAAWKMTPQQTSSELFLSLQKLNTIGSALYIAAHPDDENTRLLSYLVREKKLRTGYLSLTRGDGGQNLIGKEQGDALGLIRTQELLAARRIDGAEQFFTRANDFGYSKTPEETLNIWNRDSILSDMVWVIRNFKPVVLICRFPTTGEGGHGHHTASAILAIEAFEAAADPEKFKWQLKYTNTWKAKRIVWNTFNFGGTNTTSPNQVKIDVGAFNPLLGKGYGEIAAESRTMHKSQGFGSAKQRGSNFEYFKHLGGDTMKNNVFENVDLSWKRIKGGEKIQKLISGCLRSFDYSSPEKIIPQLTALHKEIKNLKGESVESIYWREQKIKETEKLILACAGIWAEAIAGDYCAVPGKETSVNVHVIKRNACNAEILSLHYPGSDTAMSLTLNTNELYTFKRKETIKGLYSDPYWLKLQHTAGIFNVANLSDIGKPEIKADFNVQLKIKVEDLFLDLELPVIFKQTDPVKGEVYRPFEILPPVTINISDKLFLFADENPKNIFITVKANTASVKGKIKIEAKGWKVDVPDETFDLAQKNDEIKIKATITPLKESLNEILKASAEIGGTVYSKSIQRIEYEHIPFQFILSDAQSKLIKTDLKKNSEVIGYIPGAGDDVAHYLSQAGFRVKLLNDEMLSTEDLSQYSAILTGIRAYNTNERLQVHYQKLMDYIKNGGNLIVQYNTNNRIGPVQAKIGPYPFTITRDRVTDENSGVIFLKKDHVVFSQPNMISTSDFQGWVQERGIYFTGEKDNRYETILSMNDKGEKNLDGSTIIGKYGKGNFVYSGLSFFRQIPAGVPGAYKLLINLLSLPKNQ